MDCRIFIGFQLILPFGQSAPVRPSKHPNYEHRGWASFVDVLAA